MVTRRCYAKSFPKNFANFTIIISEIAVLESLSNIVGGIKAVRLATLLKRNPGTGVSESDVSRCSPKKVFLKNSQNSQESTCAGVSFLTKFRSTHSQMFFKIGVYTCVKVCFK